MSRAVSNIYISPMLQELAASHAFVALLFLKLPWGSRISVLLTGK